MKIAFTFFVLLFVTNLLAQETRVKIYPFKSAVIEYRYEASFKGTHIKYIDDFGFKQADYIRKTENFGGNSDARYETIILIGEKAYTINLQDSTVAVGRNENYSYYLQNRNRSCTEVSEALLKAEGGWQIAGNAEYLGKMCKLWKSNKNKKLTWDGQELKSEINFMTMMVEKAVSIKTDVTISPLKFEIPSGFCYISADVYQGFAGLELIFDSAESKVENSDNHIKVEFDSGKLNGCNNFFYNTVRGEKVILRGDNSYNKTDHLIIKSQLPFMNKKKVILHRYDILMFKTTDNNFGKMQIKQINKKGYQVRYALFNKDGAVIDYSEATDEALKKEFSISLNNDDSLTIEPKDKNICCVLSY